MREVLILAHNAAFLEDRIKALPWSAALTPGAAQAHLDIGEVRSVDRGEPVLREGASADFVYSIVDGALTVEKGRSGGDAQIVGFLFQGDMFGVVHDERYTYSVHAIVPCELLALPRPAFERICDRYPSVQRAMLQMASNELAGAQDHLVILGRKSAIERVSSFLLMLSERNSRLGYPAEMPIWLPMRRADIANYLGLTLETFSRVFTDLKRRGVIQAQSMRHVRVRDVDGLRELAEKC